MSATRLSWNAAGKPSIASKFKVETGEGVCATCGDTLSGEAVTVSSIDNSAFSERHESFRLISKFVCMPCAWMYGAGRSKPGNFFSTTDKFEQAVISLESVVKGKRPWVEILREASVMPKDTECTGVLTTDVKPRLWPRARLATVGNFGLFVHAPDYDTSHWVDFDLFDMLRIVDLVTPILALGFAKASLYHGLLRDFQRFTKNPQQVIDAELAISELRKSPAFLPAILVAGVTKEERKDVSNRKPDAVLESATTGSCSDSETQLGLL